MIKGVYYLIYKMVEISKMDEFSKVAFTFILLSLLCSLNIMFFVFFLECFEIDLQFIFNSIYSFYIVFFIAGFFNLIIYLPKKKYKRYIEEIDNTSPSKRGRIITLGAIGIFISIAFDIISFHLDQFCK